MFGKYSDKIVFLANSIRVSEVITIRNLSWASNISGSLTSETVNPF